MKKFNILFALVMGAVSFTSCMDEDWKTPENITDNPPYGNNDIAVYGVTPEIKNPTVEIIETGDGGEGDDPTSDPTSNVTEITCTEAVEKANALADGATSIETYTVTGYITEVVGDVSDNQQTFWMADTKDGGKVFQAYYANLPEGVTEFAKGSKVKITGNLMKYVNGRIITIEQLKEQYKDVISNNSCKEITDDIQLQVVVNGNDQGGNIYKQISVQDATGGIIVGINATDQFAFMPVNQKILINLKGAYIGGYGEMAQIGTQYNAGIGRMEPSDWEGRVRLLTQAESADSVSAIADTIDFDGSLPKKQLWGRIVRLKDVTISGDGTQTLAPDDGSVTLSSNCANRKITGAKNSTDIVLRTSTYSDFASRQIPEGKVTIYGVCTSYRNTFQILMRTNSDLIEQ